MDGLKDFPEAIETVYPYTGGRLCIIHQIRNSMKYVAPQIDQNPRRIPKRKQLTEAALCGYTHSLREVGAAGPKREPHAVAAHGARSTLGTLSVS